MDFGNICNPECVIDMSLRWMMSRIRKDLEVAIMKGFERNIG